jgi:hypothetical protein
MSSSGIDGLLLAARYCLWARYAAQLGGESPLKPGSRRRIKPSYHAHRHTLCASPHDMMRTRRLQRLWLRPRRHPKHQDLTQA